MKNHTEQSLSNGFIALDKYHRFSGQAYYDLPAGPHALWDLFYRYSFRFELPSSFDHGADVPLPTGRS